MPIRKKGNIKVKTSPNGYGIERTGYTFYSYDKNSAALVFTFIDSDNAPVNLSKADVQLLLISDNGDEFPVDKDDIDVISAIRGTARYVIPENLLGYEGKITGHIYLDFEDGSHTDEGKFTFNIKRSAITDLASEFGKQYVQDFEDVKERVEQAGDSATKDIEKAKDDAESQIGDYVGEVESAKGSAIEDIDKALPEVVESAKQDISSSASDVQSKADQAKKDMQDNVDQVESDYQAWKEQQEKKQEDFEATTDEKVSSITERVGEAENKVTDLERHLDVGQKNYFSTGEVNNLAFLGSGESDIIAESSAYRGYSLPVSVGEIYSISRSSKTNNRFRIAYTSSEPKDGTVYFDSTSNKYDNALKIEGLLVPEDAEYMVVYLSNNNDELPNIMLNKGKKAHNWTPSSKDIVTKKEYDKLAQAIINLGGSI